MFLLFKFIFALLLLVRVNGKVKTVYLNSGVDCGNPAYQVHPKMSYLVKENAFTKHAGTSSFRNCELMFFTSEINGSICLILEGYPNHIRDSNAYLDVFDGMENDANSRRVDRLEYYPDAFNFREYCTDDQMMELYMAKNRKSVEVNIQKIRINIKIVDIRSRERKLQMEEQYCDGDYKLWNSQVTILNRDSEYIGLNESRVNKNCAVSFRKMEKNENKSICVAYIPNSNVNCSQAHWSFTIYKDAFKTAHTLYELNCKYFKAHEIHSWCSDNRTEVVTLFHQRHGPKNEPSKLFSYIISDYEGTAEQYLKKIKDELFSTPPSDNGSVSVMVIVAIVLGVLFLLALIGVVYLCKKKYNPVPISEQGDDKL